MLQVRYGCTITLVLGSNISTSGSFYPVSSSSSSSSTTTTISDEDTNIVEYTREELYEYGNGDNDEGLLLLSLYGRVYDVSEGYKYYGHGGKYHLFAGRDVTKALSTGCMAVSCLGPRYTYTDYDSDTEQEHEHEDKDAFDFELTPKTIAEGKKWISFFETHDKYHFVGVLRDGRSMDDLIDQHLDEQSSEGFTSTK